MDLSALFSRIRPVGPADMDRKATALRAALAEIRQRDPALSEQIFLDHLPDLVTGAVLGGDAEDFYLTGLLAQAAQADPSLDVVLAATLNHVVLQLNFMTRFMGRPGGAEVFVLDGSSVLFPVAMANGNVVMGVQVGNAPAALPSWLTQSGSIGLKPENLASAGPGGVGELIRAAGRTRVGCIALEAPSRGAVNLAERHADLASLVTPDTFYVIAGRAEVVLGQVDALSQAGAEPRVVTRLYYAGSEDELRAVVVATGLSSLPDISLRAELSRRIRFASTPVSQGASEVLYARFANDSPNELVKIKPPVAMRSNVPLPEEARARVSDDQLFPHSVTLIRGGTLVPSQGDFHSTFLHLSGDGELIDDVGEASNIPNTPAYEQGVVDEAGVRHAEIKLGEVMRVAGAAMPLTFTPGLHTFFSHFLLQCFPRVLVLRDLGSDARVIVDQETRPKQLEMLRLVGIDEDRLVRRPPGVSVQCDELIVPRPWPLVFSPYTLQIYDELAAIVGDDRSRPDKRYMISREYRSTWRTMLTYPGLAQLLSERYGFEEIRPEKLSLHEEIRLYRNAELLLGAEGAGLYSCCYGRQGSTFISVGDEDYIMPVIGSAATVRGFDVAYGFGESFRSDADVARRLSVGHADYAVDPSMVAVLLDELLARGKD